MRVSIRTVGPIIFVLGTLWAQIGSAQNIFFDGFENPLAFQIQTPNIELAPGEDSVQCYFFQSPNTANMAIRRWQLNKGEGILKVTLFASYNTSWQPVAISPSGTLSASNCAFASGAGFKAWLFDTRQASDDLEFPSDDGTGMPLAFELQPNQPLILQLKLFNSTAVAISANASLIAQAIAPGNPYTKSASFITHNSAINIPALNSGTATQSCPHPPGKYWWMSMRTHRFGISAKAKDGTAMLLDSTNWEIPTEAIYTAPSFYQFAQPDVTYECTYNNDSGSNLNAGESESSDEICRFVGYFFPAPNPGLCENSTSFF